MRAINLWLSFSVAESTDDINESQESGSESGQFLDVSLEHPNMLFDVSAILALRPE
ncbi:hypothetical protein H0H87_010086 [Tephrocybe sp. NHM501043]|nr:hypothetical protein H0H87_010086 [Tephrocybe sp. NHM501043]